MWLYFWQNLKGSTCLVYCHDLNIPVWKCFFQAKNKDKKATFEDVDLEP